MTPLIVSLAAVAGTTLAAVLACIPGLHVYNIFAILLLVLPVSDLPSCCLVPLAIGLVVGFAILNSLPSILLAAPDESAFLTLRPGQQRLQQGRGYEAVMLTLRGSAVAMLVLLLGIAPAAPLLLPAITRVLRPHTHWILWCVIVFMLMSEWPTRGRLLPGGRRRFLASCATTTAGLVTFLLSGLLGFILFNQSPLQASAGYQSLMPAFAGLFTIPALLTTLTAPSRIPPQSLALDSDDGDSVRQGTLAGCAGGCFAAFFPVITGGVGGLLAGHATSIQDDRAFLASQGASKTSYYVGGLLLFFVPGLNVTRGGAAWLLRPHVMPWSIADYFMALAAAGLSGAAALTLAPPLTRAMLRLIARRSPQQLSGLSLALVLGLVVALTGLPGLLVTLTATGIGLIPIAFGTRRMNCLGIILLPLAWGM